MAGITQDAFLARVRDALAARNETADLPSDLQAARVVPHSADTVAVFLEKVGQAAMNGHRVADETALVDRVLEIIEQNHAKRVLVTAEALPARDRLISRLQAASIELTDPDLPALAFDADVGITGVTTAVAETGSLHMTSGGPQRRMASLAVPCHIAIVRADQIVPDLLDLVAQTADNHRPAGEVLVSGPSKTADIELALVIGVHGPREEHIIVLG